MDWVPRGVQLVHQFFVSALPGRNSVKEYLELIGSETIGSGRRRPLT